MDNKEAEKLLVSVRESMKNTIEGEEEVKKRERIARRMDDTDAGIKNLLDKLSASEERQVDTPRVSATSTERLPAATSTPQKKKSL
jgi:hypothetical protein